MHKEAVIAIIVGLFLGLSVTFVFYWVRSKQIDKSAPPSVEEQVVQAEADAKTEEVIETSSTGLKVFSPEQGLITQNKNLEVTGETNANSLVVIFINEQDFIVSSDGSGKFSTSLLLQPGANFITASVIDDNGESTSVDRLVYLEDDLTNIEDNSNQTNDK